jgi:hypothetical protein
MSDIELANKLFGLYKKIIIEKNQTTNNNNYEKSVSWGNVLVLLSQIGNGLIDENDKNIFDLYIKQIICDPIFASHVCNKATLNVDYVGMMNEHLKKINSFSITSKKIINDFIKIFDSNNRFQEDQFDSTTNHVAQKLYLFLYLRKYTNVLFDLWKHNYNKYITDICEYNRILQINKLNDFNPNNHNEQNFMVFCNIKQPKIFYDIINFLENKYLLCPIH